MLEKLALVLVTLALLVQSVRLWRLRSLAGENALLRVRLDEAEGEWLATRWQFGLPDDPGPAWSERRLVD